MGDILDMLNNWRIISPEVRDYVGEQAKAEILRLRQERDELIGDKLRLHKLLDNNQVKAKLNPGDLLSGLDRVGYLIMERNQLTSRVAELGKIVEDLRSARTADLDVFDKVRGLVSPWRDLNRRFGPEDFSVLYKILDLLPREADSVITMNNGSELHCDPNPESPHRS